ncbi:MAG TPA: hypothetical protein PLQ93_03050 [Bacteroidia bacterium]|nr:hypothetical protein [Bacteroidia bacterium]
MKKSIALLLAVLFLLSCKKDSKIEEIEPGSVQLVFKATVNSEALVPDTKWYRNFSGDSFNISKFNYYISNLKFRNTDGSVYTVPESYYLVRHVEGVENFVINGLPEGTYNQVEFLIGVDSARNVSGSQSGYLDPGLNMFWDWNTGYIFYKLEGHCNTLTQPLMTGFAFHVGGFSGKDNCLQKCTLNLGAGLTSKAGRRSSVYIKARVEEVFQNPKNIDFDYYFGNISNAMLRELSENYKDMFLLDRIEN